MDVILNILERYHEGFIKGLIVTSQLFFISSFVGIVVGVLLGWAAGKNKECERLFKIVAFILSGIPVLILLVWMHYPLQMLLGVVIDPFYTALFTFTIVNTIGVAGLIHKAVVNFPKQYLIAAKINGLTAKQTFLKIELPLLFFSALPGILLLQVVMLHTTLFASLISVDEIFTVVQRVNTQVYKPIELYTILGLFFLVISLPINGLAVYLKKKFSREYSEK